MSQIIVQTIPITKGTPSNFELDRAALAALPIVAADSYYSNVLNWSKVILCYKSNIGMQKTSVEFDATTAYSFSIFLVSNKARNIFQISQIIIKDFDGGTFIVPRSELNVVQFDVDLTPSISGLTWTTDAPQYLLSATSNSVQKKFDADMPSGQVSTGWNFNIMSNESLSGNMSVEGKLITFGGEDINAMLGFQLTSEGPNSGLNHLTYSIYIVNSIVYYAVKPFGGVFTTWSPGSGITVSNNDTMKLTLIGDVLTIFKNSIPQGTPLDLSSISVPAPIFPLSVGLSLYEEGFKFDNIIFQNI